MPDSLPDIEFSANYPRSARLLNSAEFGRVFAKAKAFRHPHFTLLVRPGSHTGARIGFVIAKKKVRRSVSRNQIRRVVRESFRQQRRFLPPVDIVFLAKPGLGDLSNAEIRAGLAKQWKKLTAFSFN